METNTDVTSVNRLAVCDRLAHLLADEYVLYTKARHAHWNVEGPDFYDKHKFFDEQSARLNNIIDRVAERIRTLGHYVDASLDAFLQRTHLAETDPGGNDSRTYLYELLADHESIILNLREDIRPFSQKHHDEGTADFITDLMQEHEKMVWFIRAHLK